MYEAFLSYRQLGCICCF